MILNSDVMTASEFFRTEAYVWARGSRDVYGSNERAVIATPALVKGVGQLLQCPLDSSWEIAKESD